MLFLVGLTMLRERHEMFVLYIACPFKTRMWTETNVGRTAGEELDIAFYLTMCAGEEGGDRAYALAGYCL